MKKVLTSPLMLLFGSFVCLLWTIGFIGWGLNSGIYIVFFVFAFGTAELLIIILAVKGLIWPKARDGRWLIYIISVLIASLALSPFIILLVR